jgi:hypothetical protein
MDGTDGKSAYELAVNGGYRNRIGMDSVVKYNGAQGIQSPPVMMD